MFKLYIHVVMRHTLSCNRGTHFPVPAYSVVATMLYMDLMHTVMYGSPSSKPDVMLVNARVFSVSLTTLHLATRSRFFQLQNFEPKDFTAEVDDR